MANGGRAMAKRDGATLAVSLVLLLAIAGCVSKGSDAIEGVATRGSEKVAAMGVRAIAVGTWHCTEAYDEEITQDLMIGITSDGNWGTGRTTGGLQEAGTWKLAGLELEVEFPLRTSGYSIPTGLTYTGDADPPTEIDVVDHANSDSKGHFDVTVSPSRFTAQQTLTYGGEDHIKRYECDKESSREPNLRPPP